MPPPTLVVRARVRPLSRVEIAAPAADLTTVLDRRVALPAATGWEIMAEQMLLPIVLTGFTELLELGVPGSARPGPKRVM